MTFPAASKKHPTIPLPLHSTSPATHAALWESEDCVWQAPKLYKRSAERVNDRPTAPWRHRAEPYGIEHK